MSDQRPVHDDLLTLGKRALVTAQSFAAAITLALFVSEWEHPDVIAALIAIALVESGANWLLSLSLKRRLGHDRSELVRTVVNTACHCAIGVLCDWSFPSWLFVPFGASLVGIPGVQHGLPRLLTMLSTIVTCAMLTGGQWPDALAFAGLGLFSYLMILAYLDLSNKLIRELQVARQMVAAHEKLASIGHLAAGISHDLNNPMTYVTANVAEMLDALRSDPDLPERYVEYRDSIMVDAADGVARVNTVVADLRRFARGEPADHEEFDLASEVSAAVRMARSQFGPSQILDATIEPGLRMRGRAREFGQVTLGLLVNALQSIGQRGRVGVTAKRSKEWIEVAITSDGPGLPADVLDKLYGPFFTTHAGNETLELGLAGAHALVTAHAGTLEIESAEGRGTCFRIRLRALP
jgi:two-component system NtrC family sensor kinase